MQATQLCAPGPGRPRSQGAHRPGALGPLNHGFAPLPTRLGALRKNFMRCVHPRTGAAPPTNFFAASACPASKTQPCPLCPNGPCAPPTTLHAETATSASLLDQVHAPRFTLDFLRTAWQQWLALDTGNASCTLSQRVANCARCAADQAGQLHRPPGPVFDGQQQPAVCRHLGSSQGRPPTPPPALPQPCGCRARLIFCATRRPATTRGPTSWAATASSNAAVCAQALRRRQRGAWRCWT